MRIVWARSENRKEPRVSSRCDGRPELQGRSQYCPGRTEGKKPTRKDDVWGTRGK